MNFLRFAFTIAITFMTFHLSAQKFTIDSPGRDINASIIISDAGGLFYNVNYKGQPVILQSKLGFNVNENFNLTSGFLLITKFESTHNQSWKPIYGERSTIVDNYKAITLKLINKTCNNLLMNLECRAYDQGFAFRYVFPKQECDALKINKELTEYTFTGDHRAWPVYSAQQKYKPSTVSRIKPGCERPLTIETTEGAVIAIGEAGLFSFSRMKYAPLKGKANTLTAKLDSTVQLAIPGKTPWRFVMTATDAGALLESNDLLLNLNEPCKIKDTSWIKPGKVIREVSLTTQGGMACIDFAKEMNLQYIEYDAGWYGHEYDKTSDARTVTLDPKRSKGPLDLPAVIDYGKKNGIGIIVYVNRNQLEPRLDEILPLYKKWGIAGMKYGFVNVGNQKWTTWLHDAIRKAAEAEMMIDIHDEYRMTGNQRTYPNIMTVEGIAGNETMPPADHNCAIPFTRYLCGAGDYTHCWYNGRVQNSLAHQLALTTVTYSPWQFLFWYDRPSAFKNEPELDFWRKTPTTWDDTKVINAKIGVYVTVARRSGEQWFVGTINAIKRRKLQIPLSFLKPNQEYNAFIYSDGAPDGSDKTRVKCDTAVVNSTGVITAEMAENGGHAIRFEPRFNKVQKHVKTKH